MLRFTTAGESHGPALVSILEGAPAGIPLLAQDIDDDLGRRQQGYGRGRRMQIEKDQVELLSGVRAGYTLGSPIAMLIRNRDWKNWQDIMDPAPNETDPEARKRSVTRPRPGHADLPGMLKYDRDDARDILERASARETTARVAAGAICRKLLSEIGVTIGSHIVELGGVSAAEVLKGVGAVLLIALTIAAVSLACSASARRTQTATVTSYAIVGLLVVGTFAFYGAQRALDRRPDGSSRPTVLLLNPFAATAEAIRGRQTNIDLSSPFVPLQDLLATDGTDISFF